ncbi:UNVERIFIED_CONTAM: ATP-binding protein [Microbacterium sp. SLM126]
MTARVDARTAVTELRAAIEMLDGVVQLRLEERRGGITGRPLSIETGDEGIPPLSRYEGTGPLAAAIGVAGLTAPEALVLLAAIAPSVDERFAVAFGLLTDRPGVTGLTGEVARTLVARSFAGRLDANALLSEHGALRRSGLLVLDGEDGLDGVLRPEPALRAWVLGLAPPAQTVTPDFPARPLATVHSMADVVVPARTSEQLRELEARIRLRERVSDDWGFAAHHDGASGVIALFHGPPGTGKTMTAAAVAGAVGLPAYIIDLSALVSKYIGETEKALAKVFDRAAREHCVLVFDEADAVFGTRTEVSDAHDRYANQEVSYLLTRVESHPGVVILTSNLLANIDQAFQRRIAVMIEFPAPGRAERERIWRGILPSQTPVAADVDFAMLAERFALTGAQIRDAAIEAAYLAAASDAAVSHDLLVTAVRRQYAKAGRTVPS